MNTQEFKEQAIEWDQAVIDAVRWITDQFNGALMFCGSFGLVLNGKLKRKVTDIDVITFENHYGSGIGEYGTSGRFEVDGVEVLCFKMLSPSGVNIDVMYVNAYRHEFDCNGRYDEIKFVDRIIKVEKPQFAIQAKKQYLQSSQLQHKDKHIRDLWAMGELPPAGINEMKCWTARISISGL